MSVVIITGSSGLIGSEAVRYYTKEGYKVIGIDNNMRKVFFGEEGDTNWNTKNLQQELGPKFEHYDEDIQNYEALKSIFGKYKENISLIIHTAAQPSHDWAMKNPFLDFGVNATGTLNLLEAYRSYCPDAVFIFTSTNKVYGDRPNTLPMNELKTRWEIDENHSFTKGIPEECNVDQCMHSLFGTSKLAADLLVQEYGRYFQLKTYCLRGGVLSGSKQSGVQLHGFLNYLMKCTIQNKSYTIFGYKGKQVRDVIHSKDVIAAMDAIYNSPVKGGTVYNLGGGRTSNISIIEAIELAQEITGKKLQYSYSEEHRKGDHIWYITDLTKFKQDYPGWDLTYDIHSIMEEIYKENKKRWQ